MLFLCPPMKYYTAVVKSKDALSHKTLLSPVSLLNGLFHSFPLTLLLKVLDYADDTLVFLNQPSDFHRLQHHLDTYCKASNAKLNINKT